MATTKTCIFFESGSHAQFEYVLGKYDEALKVKAHDKSSKPENLIKLDKWYQTELPKKIKSRGKEPFLTHDEIVQCIKWKLARGQFRPRLKDLVQMNTPRVVMQETKKAFRNLFKRNDIESAVQAMSNLKGVGPAMASAVLAAGAPHLAPFMADECLLSLPEMEGIDYTLKEYLRLVEKTKECVERLNSEGGCDWTPHKVELAVWTHYVARELKPELLEDMPGSGSKGKTSLSPVKKDGGGGTEEESTSSTTEATNGVNGVHSSNNSGKEEEDSATTAATAAEAADSKTETTTTPPPNDAGDTSTSQIAAVDEEENVAKTSTVTTTPAAPHDNGDATAAEDSSHKEATTTDVAAVEKEEKQEKTPEKAAAVQEPAPEKEEEEASSKVNGEAETSNGAAQENGSHNSSDDNSSSSTKEEIFNGESVKRPLDSEDSQLSEAKRLKDDVPAQPIQAN